MMPTIRIDDDVFEGLKSLAEPFTDTPNSVIRKLLDDRGALPKPLLQTKTTRNTETTPINTKKNGVMETASGLTPQPIYETFLLYSLAHSFKGKGGKHEVTKDVIEQMKNRGFISIADLERVATGETKAENTVAWGRNALKERGLISRISPRGIWELTPDGMQAGQSTTLPVKS